MSENATNLWKDWKLHLLVFAIVLVTELIGTHRIPIGAGVILLLPMLYAVIVGIAVYFTPLVTEKMSKNAESLVFISVTLLIAKFGVQAGPALPQLIEAGPALMLQELGNLGTIFIALPIAVFLGLKREAIGMTHSIGREPNLALITDKYGLSSPEGRGVMAIYIFGTVFGSIFLGLISGFLATATPLHPYSFAMATGVGSGSMAAASLGPLVAAYPDMADTITAFSGASNLLTSVTGLYASIFIGLPLTVKLYNVLSRVRDKKAANSTTKGA
ncbi:DUF3100 domain-containing protein [Fredinandcohnia onubensis]|jgi:hypothetical protein|uniref:DUF3100 domain-containing protein n=1 Tax=Fredinandcohnia onubensis TaxID=1571209 RepID=UPI000C0BF4FE|nr:DUF3100 domain-containing protein [Fredinandcohnia onubensis]